MKELLVLEKARENPQNVLDGVSDDREHDHACTFVPLKRDDSDDSKALEHH